MDYASVQVMVVSSSAAEDSIRSLVLTKSSSTLPSIQPPLWGSYCGVTRSAAMTTDLGLGPACWTATGFSLTQTKAAVAVNQRARRPLPRDGTCFSP